MAIARATYHVDDEAAVTVEVEATESYPDLVAEVTTRCRHLFRDVLTDWNAMADEDQADGGAR